MANEYKINRVAFGKLTYPSTVASSLAASADLGVYIPKGAIVTGIKCFAGGAITNAASLGNVTASFLVGGQQIATNNRVLSAAFVQTVVNTVALSATPVYIGTGGALIMSFASTNSARSGVVLDGDVYVEYLYCGDRDAA